MWTKVLNRPLVQGQSAVHLAVMTGQVRALRWMLRRGASPDDRDLDGFGALNCAAMHEDSVTAIALLGALLDAGLSVDTPDAHDGATALHSAAFFDRREVMGWLLKRGATIDAGDEAGRTPVMHALAGDKLQAAALLLAWGAKADARDHFGDTMLLQTGCTAEWADLLLAHGADLRRVDGEGRNLLHLAALRGDKAMLRWALKQGVDPTQLDIDGMTPLDALEMEMFEVGMAQSDRSRLDTTADFGAGDGFGPYDLDEAEPAFESSLMLLRRHQPGPVAQA